MKKNLFAFGPVAAFSATVFIHAHCAMALPAGNFRDADACTALKQEKLNAGFNTRDISLSSFAFTENKGQVWGYDGLAHPEVKFVFQEGNTQIFLLENGIAYQFTRVHYPEGYNELVTKQHGHGSFEETDALQKKIRVETFRMDMTLPGANVHAAISTEGKSADYTNYYNHEVLDVHQYKKIIYHDIYAGIDWIIYTKDGQVKYDFVVRPGADPANIKMQFGFQEELTLGADGSLNLTNILGSITEKKPVSFQGQNKISTAFRLSGNTVSFEIAPYKEFENLVIDPVLLWASYYGGPDPDYGRSCTLDGSGNVYLAGTAFSSASLAAGGHQNTFGGGQDAFLAKFNSNGIRQWATYYGGTGPDGALSSAVDGSGNVYLGGFTDSYTGIASGGHQNTTGYNGDAFLVKFNNSGVRQWATYYGGVGDEAQYVSCATDGSGNVYLAGATNSQGLASGGHQNAYGGGLLDAFLVKFSSTGVREWATYYGDSDFEETWCCATDASGNIYLAGYAQSTISIASGGHQNNFGGAGDAFLVKFNSAGTRLWGTYYGGTGFEQGFTCATDGSGNVYLGGVSSSSGLSSGGHQNTIGGDSDAFLVKFNGNGVRQWATYYGGTGYDEAKSCATDGSGNVYLAGNSQSASNIASGGHQDSYAGNQDAFIAKFNSLGTRLWGTYYGGTGNEEGNACVAESPGRVYLAGSSTSSTGIALGGHQNTLGSDNGDAFLAKLNLPEPTDLRDENRTRKNLAEVFPNPNNGRCEICLEGYLNIRLYNETGQIVWENRGSQQEKCATVQGLPKGMYLALIANESGGMVKKIVVISD